ncbi:MAG: hypothetical protein H6828_08960 [Planctomycetes bacterium]|nr:hypothetical protein [Planctomycetota bacterium]
MSVRPRFLLACCAPLLCLACRSAPEAPRAAWEPTRAGTFGVGAKLGLATGYEVDSVVAIDDANFGEPSGVHGEMKGKFGLGLAAEYWAIDDLAVFAGAEVRLFEPDLGSDLISFGDIDQLELFLGTRWLLPCGWRARRLRPFVHAKLAYIPGVDFDMTTTLPFPDPLNDAVLVSPYRGSGYWSLGGGLGLAYQLDEHWYAYLSVIYEWALTESKAYGVPTTLQETTGNAFVDNIMNSLSYDITIDPQGWIGFAGVSYGF